MNRAIITHFDGDPFMLSNWLYLFDRYWGSEVSKVYASFCYSPELVTPDILEVDKKMLSKYPQIEVTYIDHQMLPEMAAPIALKQVKEPYLGFVESDGLIFGQGLVDECFRKLEVSGVDVVAAPYDLFPPVLQILLRGWRGFMRNFFFCRRDILESTDLNFCPIVIPKGFPGEGASLDVFGWISLQLALIEPPVVVFSTEANNLHPSDCYDLGKYKTYKWLHIRQMSSSVVGFGADPARFHAWAYKDMEAIKKLFPEEVDPTNFSSWVFAKTCAFRMLMLENFQGDYIPLFDDYIKALNNMRDYFQISSEVYRMKDFYKKLIYDK